MMEKGRLEAFSDAVIAVAITLLALELHVPAADGDESLVRALLHEWPSYAAYVVSFLTIGIIWINHHRVLQRCSTVDHTVLVVNLVLLMIVVILPFTTALLAEHLDDARSGSTAAAVYSGSYLVMGFAFAALQAVALRPHLTASPHSSARRRHVLRRSAAGWLPYAIATALAFLTPYATLALCGATALYYALPPANSETVRPFPDSDRGGS